VGDGGGDGGRARGGAGSGEESVFIQHIAFLHDMDALVVLSMLALWITQSKVLVFCPLFTFIAVSWNALHFEYCRAAHFAAHLPTALILAAPGFCFTG